MRQYGALSVDAGGRVRWRLDGDIFAMSWTERNGPPVSDQSAVVRQHGRRLNGELSVGGKSSLISALGSDVAPDLPGSERGEPW